MPRHVAIIMDGNGRWAQARHRRRHAGHRAGLKAARAIVRAAGNRGIEILTLFAFSHENWQRPKAEVGLLMELFLSSLRKEIAELNSNRVRVRFIGARENLAPDLQAEMAQAEALTAANSGLTLVVATSYSGRWDVVQASRKLARQALAGELDPAAIDEAAVARAISIGDLPEPDLFIRTGGEHRISNFLLWSLAYTELYFTETLWPDFNSTAFDTALEDFAGRERRFGRTAEQVEGQQIA